MSDGYTEGMLLSEFLAGQTPVGNCEVQSQYVPPNKYAGHVPDVRLFQSFTPPRIDGVTGKLVNISA